MRKTNTSTEENERIKRYAISFIDSQEKFKKQEAAYKTERKEFQETIRDFMNKNNMKKFRFMSPRGKKFSISDVKQRKIVWIVDNLKQVLPKSVQKAVIKRKYTVNDWEGFKDYMKALGADPKVLISYFDVEESVDEQALNEAGEQEMVTDSDLEGCYEIKENEGYVRITELE